MSSGVISQKQDLLERQLSELLSKDEDQWLRGTEGQVQELPHEESVEVDKETSGDLTEEQYDHILEMLGKVQLLLEETTANYARQTRASIQEPVGVSNSTSSWEYVLPETTEQLAERQPEQLEERQPEKLGKRQPEQLAGKQPSEREFAVERQPEQLEERQPEKLGKRQPEQLAGKQPAEREFGQPVAVERQPEQLERQPEQLGERQPEQLEKRQPEQLAGKQPAEREFGQPVVVERQLEQPVERQLTERLYLEKWQPRQQEMQMKWKQLKRRLYKGNGSEQTMEREFDLSEHTEAMNGETELLELEHKSPEVVWAPMLEGESKLPTKSLWEPKMATAETKSATTRTDGDSVLC